MIETVIGVLHLFAALVLGTAIAIQVLALGPRMPREDLPAIQRLSRIALAAMLVAVLCGLALWLWVGKPAAFYNTNLLFRIKLLLFVLLLIVTVWPALFFQGIRPPETAPEETPVPGSVRWSLRTALVVVLCIPALAYMMARGLG